MNKVFTVLKEDEMGNKNGFEEKFQIILNDRMFTEMHPEDLVKQGLCCKDKYDALILFSLAAYIRKDYLPAFFHRALVYYDFGNYDQALFDIQHCRDLDLDNQLYERWENMLNNLVHATHESDC